MRFTIRQAKIKDLLKTLDWANEKETISNSINRTKKVSLKEHSKWFKKYIKSKYNLIFIAQLKNEPIGMVRIDYKKKDLVLSYLIDKKKRKKGLGFEMLKKIIKKFTTKSLKTSFKAQVKSNNLASNAIFVKLGFKKIYFNRNKKVFSYKLSL